MSDQLRILVVTNLWPEGGSFRGIFVQEQVQALRALGHQVDVEVVAQSRGRADYLAAVPRVRRRVRQGGYDVVHVHYGLTALAARFAGNTPRVLTLHGTDVWSRWQSQATRLGSGRVAAKIYVSPRLAEAAGDPTGLVIPCGLDFSLFTPIDRATARSRLGIDHDRPVILFGGRREQPVKRYDLFQTVLAAVRARGIAAEELVLAEPGQPRDAVPLKFAAADLLLFTSEHEGSPMVVKEACAMGLPVVSTAVGDVATVLDGVTPSAVVPLPVTWPAAEAAGQVTAALAEQAIQALTAGTRSNGRARIGRLDNSLIATQLVEIYRAVTRAG